MSSRLQLEQLKEKIEKLDANEHRQIYQLMKRMNQLVTTKTQQGILVTANSLSPETIAEIEKYVHFCLDQRKRMDEDAKVRKEYERMV